jgi:hypothetical protein
MAKYDELLTDYEPNFKNKTIMKREQAKQLLPIIQAYAEGKAIEFKTEEGEWVTSAGINLGFRRKPEDYRIKPEPEYRPFENAEECWAEMQKHQPFGWVVSETRKGKRYSIVEQTGQYPEGNALLCGRAWKYDEMYITFLFADGAPFGIKVEEE